MAETKASHSTEDPTLQEVYDQAMKLFDTVNNGNEATNSDPVQMMIKTAISKFENTTNMVSELGIFSSNESIDELPTDSLQYLLLPALLGTLSLKLSNQQRKDVIHVAEIYFRDFLQRCKDYGVTDVEVPQPSEDASSRPATEQAKISSMVLTREAKIKRYKEMKELQDKLTILGKAMKSPNIDERDKREYFTTLLQSYVSQALDELASIEQEKPILDYMAKHAGEPRHKEPRRAPLKPVIITRDAVQKAVYGLGYPSIPALTIEEFYDQRVRDGTFPAASNIQHQTIRTAEADPDDADEIRKELMEEADDTTELEKQREMDEYKDDHRRGWGNRHNRS